MKFDTKPIAEGNQTAHGGDALVDQINGLTSQPLRVRFIHCVAKDW